MIGKALVACEESQAVCIALRAKGWEAYSCDILSCSGGHPEWHIQDDINYVLSAGYNKTFFGYSFAWDLIIAFPPCTYLTVSNTYLKRGCSKYTAAEAEILRQQAKDFFMMIVNCKCNLIAIENPIGIMSTEYRKPDQIIQPYQFGHDASKKTCLWLKGLPKLEGTKFIFPDMKTGRYGNQTPSGQNKLGPSEDRAKLRSKTYPGIAQAMADQWTDFYIKQIIRL